MQSSPLGKYAQPVAAITAVVGIIGALLLQAIGHATAYTDAIGYLAAGAVFGASASTAATNGTLGRKLTALHARLDKAGVPPDGGEASDG